MSVLSTMREPSRDFRLGVLFLLNLVIWTYAGYAIGEAQGRGWRGAVTHGTNCQIVCKM